MNFDSLFLSQLEKYPLLTCQDCVKALYQSVFGCGHFVDEAGRKYLEDELKTTVPGKDSELLEPIGDDYCRIHISKIAEYGLEPETLFRLFRLGLCIQGADTHDDRKYHQVCNNLHAVGIYCRNNHECSAY